jgi:hypothetical protein
MTSINIVKHIAIIEDSITIGRRLLKPIHEPRPASSFISPPPKPSTFRHSLYNKLIRKNSKKPKVPPINDTVKSMPVSPTKLNRRPRAVKV